MVFTPRFWKEKGRRSKGVDITLTKDMLGHGYHGNYDVAVLWAGDEDYVPLVNEVKRMGKAVYVVFFERSCLDEELRLASDFCLDVEPMFLDSWLKGTAESK